MKDLRLQHARWVSQELDKMGHGSRTRYAKALGITADMVTRITNVEPGKEFRKLTTEELIASAKFFNQDPPGLVQAREVAPYGGKGITQVKLLGRIAAGERKSPMTLVNPDRAKVLTLSGLGAGDFIALELEKDGDSMDRISPPGSVIIVNQADKALISGCCYVFRIDGEDTYKMWQDDSPPYLAPYSTNPIYKPRFIRKKRDHFEVVGRVKRSLIDL